MNTSSNPSPRISLLAAAGLLGLVSSPAPAATRTVLNVNDSGPGSLREAIALADPGDTIVFSDGLAGTIQLISGDLTISKSLTIAGPGASVIGVNGVGASRVFEVTAGDSTISGLAIAGGFDPTSGAGINNGASLTVSQCQFTGNSAADGGAIYNDSGSTLVIDGCAFYANEADSGGAIYNGGTAQVTNTTITANRANNGSGVYSSTLGSLSLNHVTLVRNGGASDTYGGLYVSAGPASIGNSLIALNVNSGFGGPDVTGGITSLGHNLIGDADDSSGWVASDLTGSGAGPLDPVLGPFQDHGGPTFTVPLLAGSPALDAGAAGTPTDQRETARPFDDPGVANAPGGNGSDIGAFERAGPDPASLVVFNNNDAGVGSLRQAVLDVGTFGIPTITFAPHVVGSIMLTSGQIPVDQGCSILGPGSSVVELRATGGNRVFETNTGPVELSGLTIANGFDLDYGGNINNHVELTVTACVLTGGNSHDGGGIHNETTGTLLMTDSTVHGNDGETGAGLANRGDATLRNCTFTRNGESGGSVNGCAVYNLGNLAVEACTLAGNGNGSIATGGSLNNSGTASIGNTIVAGNTSSFGGADVAGTFSSLGYNLIGATNDSTGWMASDLGGSTGAPLDPVVGPLQDNGGPTPTLGLLTGSPALDAGVAAGLSTDQRGEIRPHDLAAIADAAGGDGSDIGAYEYRPPVLTLTGTPPELVLRWPIFDPDFTLEHSPDLGQDIAWSPVPARPVVMNGHNHLTIETSDTKGKGFYRLSK